MTRLEKYRQEKERIQRRKENFTKRMAVFTILFMAVVVVGSLIYYFCFVGAWSYYSKGADCVLEQNTLKDFELFSSDSRIVKNYKNLLLICDKNGVKAYDKNGENKWSVSLSLNEPFLDVCKNYILAADRSGKKLYIIRSGKIIQECEMQYNITNASVKSDGGFVVITDDSGYKSLVTIKNSSGKEVFSWHSANAYAIDADFSDDYRNIMISTLNTSVMPSGNREYSSAVQIFDVKKAESVFSKTAEEDMYVSVESVRGGFVVVSQKQVTKFDAAGNEKAKFVLNGKCAEFAFDSGKTAVVAFDGQYKDTITLLDENLKVLGSREAGSRTVDAIDLYSNVLAYAADDEIYICKENLDIRYRIKTDRLYKNIKLFCRGKRAFVLGESAGAVIETK